MEEYKLGGLETGCLGDIWTKTRGSNRKVEGNYIRGFLAPSVIMAIK